MKCATQLLIEFTSGQRVQTLAAFTCTSKNILSHEDKVILNIDKALKIRSGFHTTIELCSEPEDSGYARYNDYLHTMKGLQISGIKTPFLQFALRLFI